MQEGQDVTQEMRDILKFLQRAKRYLEQSTDTRQIATRIERSPTWPLLNTMWTAPVWRAVYLTDNVIQVRYPGVTASLEVEHVNSIFFHAAHAVIEATEGKDEAFLESILKGYTVILWERLFLPALDTMR